MTTATIRTASHRSSLIELLMTPRQRRTRRQLLDLRELPDHLKRDIGVLDGQEVRGNIRWDRG